MIFRNIRRSWHQERFKNHWSQIETLLGFREKDERHRRKRRVLAYNYELVSHATRALEALRKAEELGANLTENVSEVREYLQHLLDLPAVARASLESTSQGKIDRLYSEYLTYRQGDPSSGPEEATTSPKEERPVQEPQGSPPLDETALLNQLDAKAQRRLDDLDSETALILVSTLRAKKLEQGVEADGLSLAERPMPVEAQVRLMRMIYALVGQPFDGEAWYNILIATWLTFNVKHDRGELEFDYQHTVDIYRNSVAPQLGESVEAEAAYANAIGAIYSLITDKPYDFTPPRSHHDSGNR